MLVMKLMKCYLASANWSWLEALLLLRWIARGELLPMMDSGAQQQVIESGGFVAQREAIGANSVALESLARPRHQSARGHMAGR